MADLVRDVARQYAEEVRSAYGAGTIPVDPYDVAQQLGIHVREEFLDSGTSGLIRKRRGEDPLIMVNLAQSWLRRRFTVAHEIGHYIERMVVQRQPDEDFGFIESRGTRQTAHEFFANVFATNLLMPEDRLRLAHDARPSPIALASEFRVSVAAMKTRLLELGILDG